jgi:hypothetical protein
MEGLGAFRSHSVCHSIIPITLISMINFVVRKSILSGLIEMFDSFKILFY